MKKYGFYIPSIEQPLTEEQCELNDKKAKQLNFYYFSLLIATIITFLATIFFEGYTTYFITRTLYATSILCLFFYMIFHQIAAPGYLYLKQLPHDPLTPAQCSRLLKWSNECPEILAYVKKVNNMTRLINKEDYLFLRSYFQEKQKLQEALYSEESCKQLHSIN